MKHDNCCCPDCSAARRSMVRSSHPILSHMHDEPMPSMLSLESMKELLDDEEQHHKERIEEIREERKALGICEHYRQVDA